jgi:spermidine/putrescine transport system permease protein
MSAEPARKKRRTGARFVRWGKRLLRLHAILAFLFLYLPIMILVAFSFNDSKLGARWAGFTFDWYTSLLTSESILSSTWNTLLVGVISTIVATIIGTMTAIAMERFRFPLRRLTDGVLYLPVIAPEIITGVSLLVFFSFTLSAINDLFNLSGDSAWRAGLFTVTLTHIAFNIAFVAVVARTSLKDFPVSLEHAAQDLGANEWLTFRRVTLPLIMPGIVAGALLAFTLSLDDFVITFFVSGPGSTTLPVRVYSMIKFGVTPEVNAISTLMLLASTLLVIISLVVQRR